MAISITDLRNSYSYITFQNRYLEGGLVPFLGFQSINKTRIQEVYPELFAEDLKALKGVRPGMRLISTTGFQLTNSIFRPYGLMVFYKDRVLLHYDTQAALNFFPGRALEVLSKAFGVLFVEGFNPSHMSFSSLCRLIDPSNHYSGPIAQRFKVAPQSVLCLDHLVIETFDSNHLSNLVPVRCKALVLKRYKPLAVIGTEVSKLPYIGIPNAGDVAVAAVATVAACNNALDATVSSQGAVVAYDNPSNSYQSLDAALHDCALELSDTLAGRYARAFETDEGIEGFLRESTSFPTLRADIARVYSATDYGNDNHRPAEVVLCDFRLLAGFLSIMSKTPFAYDRWFDPNATAEERMPAYPGCLYVVSDNFTKALRVYDATLKQADAQTSEYLLSLANEFNLRVSEAAFSLMRPTVLDDLQQPNRQLPGHTRYTDDQGYAFRPPKVVPSPTPSVTIDPSLRVGSQIVKVSTFLEEDRLVISTVEKFFENLLKVASWRPYSEIQKTLPTLDRTTLVEHLREELTSTKTPLSQILTFDALIDKDILSSLTGLRNLYAAVTALASAFTVDAFDDRLGSEGTKIVRGILGVQYRKFLHYKPDRFGFEKLDVTLYKDHATVEATLLCHILDNRYTGPNNFGTESKETRDCSTIVRPLVRDIATTALTKAGAKDVLVQQKDMIALDMMPATSWFGRYTMTSRDNGRRYRISFNVPFEEKDLQVNYDRIRSPRENEKLVAMNLPAILASLCRENSQIIAIEKIRPMISQVNTRSPGQVALKFATSYVDYSTHSELFSIDFEEHLRAVMALLMGIESNDSKDAVQRYVDHVVSLERSYQLRVTQPLEYISEVALKSIGKTVKTVDAAMIVALLTGGFYE